MISNWPQRLRDLWYFLITFFPVHLFILHLRRSHLLNIFWLILFGFVGGFFAESYGLRYLFLTPEYLGKISFASYGILGITAGLFIMAFHINSYIYYSYRFPFLATLQRPLWKFSINNSIVPVFFYFYLVFSIINFLIEEGIGAWAIAQYVGALFLGTILIIAFTFGYFMNTIKVLEPHGEGRTDLNPMRTVKKLIKTRGEMHPGKAVINYYLRTPFAVKITRPADHYNFSKLIETIEQHHFSASIYFLILIMITMAFNLVGDYPLVQIPAGATVFLIFSLYLMIVGAFYSRLKTWTITAGIVVFIILNYFSGKPQFRSVNYAYGMNYERAAPYNYERLQELTTDSIVNYDHQQELQVLENWKNRQNEARPKMVILNLSGGGQRSALWAVTALQKIEAELGEGFYRRIHLITGSSGGMLGGAFYREARFRQDFPGAPLKAADDTLRFLIAKDLLNPVCYTLAVNDLFFRLREVQYNGRTYPLDRGYTFDRELEANTLGLLSRDFGEYRSLEASARMPTMILGPSIVGDGRKLLMGSRGLSYLTFTKPFKGISKQREYDGVEYLRFFEEQSPRDLRFATALRMSASFPYITPLINMPSEPGMELIDAGVRDNEGFELGLRYIFEFREWIRKNTSGVVVVQIKANRPDEVPIRETPVTRLDRLVLPIGGVYKSFHNLQVYNKALLMELSRDELELPMEVVRFSLFKKEDNVSLSWHLTGNEKHNIISTIDSEFNREALADLAAALQLPLK